MHFLREITVLYSKAFVELGANFAEMRRISICVKISVELIIILNSFLHSRQRTVMLKERVR